MSADAWSVCPRCKANGDIGYKGYEFREDWEIGLNEGWVGEVLPTVLVKYSGECERCGLLVTFEHRHPVTWEPQPEQRPWSQIPAGWLVEHPKQPDTWLKVLATKLVLGKQQVRLEFPDGRVGAFTYPKATRVICKPGAGVTEVSVALETLGEGAYILDDAL
jgi:hypothetical protein